MSDQNSIHPEEEKTQSETDTLKIDMLKMHWENYQMRQSHVWKSLERLIFAIVTLWAIPFIKPDLFKEKYIIFLFPVVALFLSIVGLILLKAEYRRLRIVIERFDEFTPNRYKLNFKDGFKDKNRIIHIKPGLIGKLMLNVICIGIIILSTANLIFIIIILRIVIIRIIMIICFII